MEVLLIPIAPQARYTTYALGTIITVVAIFYFKGLRSGSGYGDKIAAGQ